MDSGFRRVTENAWKALALPKRELSCKGATTDTFFLGYHCGWARRTVGHDPRFCNSVPFLNICSELDPFPPKVDVFLRVLFVLFLTFFTIKFQFVFKIFGQLLDHFLMTVRLRTLTLQNLIVL